METWEPSQHSLVDTGKPNQGRLKNKLQIRSGQEIWFCSLCLALPVQTTETKFNKLYSESVLRRPTYVTCFSVAIFELRPIRPSGDLKKNESDKSELLT